MKAAVVVCGLCIGTAFAGETRTPSLQLEGGGSYENLDSGYDDWTSSYLEGAWSWAPRKTFYSGVRRTERFGLEDSELWAGAYYPLSKRVTGVLDASVSPTHDVLPKWSALGQVEIALDGGFGLQLGGRHTEYTDTNVDQGIATVEYYFGNNRIAYTFYRTYLEGDNPVNAHRLAVAHYYGRFGERSSFGLAGSTGQEVESQGAGRVFVTDVRSAVLVGRHWLSQHWALSYEAGQHRAVDRYLRNAVRIGVRYEF